jgi:hypothetical protein
MNDQLKVFLDLTYWLPFGYNSTVFLLRTIKEYRADLADREEALKETHSYYHPNLTVGHVVARTLGTILPIVNIIAMFCNIRAFLDLIHNMVKFIIKVLDKPLVPKHG